MKWVLSQQTPDSVAGTRHRAVCLSRNTQRRMFFQILQLSGVCGLRFELSSSESFRSAFIRQSQNIQHLNLIKNGHLLSQALSNSLLHHDVAFTLSATAHHALIDVPDIYFGNILAQYAKPRLPAELILLCNSSFGMPNG